MSDVKDDKIERKIIPIGRWILCEKLDNKLEEQSNGLHLRTQLDYKMARGTIKNFGTIANKDILVEGDTIISSEAAVVTAELYNKKYMFVMHENIFAVERDEEIKIEETSKIIV